MPNDPSERKRKEKCALKPLVHLVDPSPLLTFTNTPPLPSAYLFRLLSGFNNTPKSTNTGSYTDDTPKGALRVLNSLQAQQAYREKKKSGTLGSSSSTRPGTPGSTGKTPKPTPSLPKILPGERLGEYNRRLEDHLRPEVTGAIKAAAAVKAAQEKEVWMEKKRRREEAKEDKKRKERGEEKEKQVGPTLAAAAAAKGKRKATIMDDTDDEDDEDAQPNRTTGPKRPKKTEFETLPVRRGITDVVQAPPARLPSLKRLPKQTGGAFSTTGRTPLNPGQKRLMEEERERVIKRYREMKEEKLQQREAAK